MPFELLPWISLRCTESLFYELQVMDPHGQNPIRQYVQHKRHAQRRGISFELTLAEWWGIWKDSGHYHQRGTKRNQYVMARNNDRGPYAVGNVSIRTALENRRTAVRVQRESKLLRNWVPSHPEHHSRPRVAVAT